ncbi:MAG: hypothetical protein HYY44_08850, partial [Deltaproteobacteria bacterium]|nr:hypothetical protein [Deltaproteobacteria bacterium]
PSADISSLDKSLSSSSSSALTVQAATVVVDNGLQAFENSRAEGKSSRAGCESNMHKQEIFRMGLQVELEKCYPTAMEAGGLITIPDGSQTLFHIQPPDPNEIQDIEQEEQHGKGGQPPSGQRPPRLAKHTEEVDTKESFCGDIPDEFEEEKAACEGGEHGGPESIKMRIGRGLGTGKDELQIDLCFGPDGGETLESEGTYTSDESLYTANMVRIGKFLGTEEKMSFDMTVDLGTGGTVTDGEVDLGTDGAATAIAKMNGKWGGGHFVFTADQEINTLRGGFSGEFKDPVSKTRTVFCGKTDAVFSATEGCAKFQFKGAPPAMRMQDMIPYGIPAAQLDGFLKNIKICGANPTSTTYRSISVCPNPDFDPTQSGEVDCPMIATKADGTCEEVTHTGVECFAISNGSSDGDFGKQVTQTFKRIADSKSSYFSVVKDIDMTAIACDKPAIEFPRPWDCTGSFTEVDFSGEEEFDFEEMDTAMSRCFALEEKAFANRGMGGYNCHQEENMNGINKIKDDGPPPMGKFGGELQRDQSNMGTCTTSQAANLIRIDPIDTTKDEYCIPTERSCVKFSVSAKNAVMPAGGITMQPHLAMTAIAFTQADTAKPATAAAITFGANACVANYTLKQHTFEKPKDDFGGAGGTPTPGTQPGQVGGPPQACIDKFGTDVTKPECESLCNQKGVDCRS